MVSRQRVTSLLRRLSTHPAKFVKGGILFHYLVLGLGRRQGRTLDPLVEMSNGILVIAESFYDLLAIFMVWLVH